MNIEIDDKVKADIGAEEKYPCWIDCIVSGIDEKFITVRELDTDDEWTLPRKKVVK